MAGLGKPRHALRDSQLNLDGGVRVEPLRLRAPPQIYNPLHPLPPFIRTNQVKQKLEQLQFWVFAISSIPRGCLWAFSVKEQVMISK